RYSTNNASPALKRRVTLCPNASSNIHLAPTSSFTSSNLFISCHLAYLYLINLGSRSYLVVDTLWSQYVLRYVLSYLECSLWKRRSSDRFGIREEMEFRFLGLLARHGIGEFKKTSKQRDIVDRASISDGTQ
ncbi:hypothetical protein WG66_010936, partial [Moniliophthora roreri]